MSYFLKNILLNFYLILQIFVVSMGLLCGSFSYAETDIAQENIPYDVDEVKNSVVRLELKLKKAPVRSGTGFILEDGVLVTNFHVLKALLSKKKLLNKEKLSNKITPDFLSQIKIFQEDRLLDVQITSIQALDSVHDLALVNIKGSKIPPAIKKPRRKVDLTKEELFFVGYPRKKLKAIGQNAPIEIFESKDHTEAHMPISSFFSVNNDLPGASGSPIVNQRGELVGVLNTGVAFENKIIFADSNPIFSLQNAEYGVQCSKNKSIKKCFKQVKNFHIKEAKKGNTYAQYQLGFIFKEFNKYKKAIKHLELAAQQGSSKAYLLLGSMYSLGEGVSQDYKKAIKYLELAAQQGYSGAYYALGSMYFLDEGMLQDNKKAIKYLKLAAQQGNINAYLLLGNMYLYGEGVSQDDKKAIKYLKLAAQTGHTKSYHIIANLYLYGHSEAVPQDSKKAIKYLELAAQQGSSAAYYALGNMHLYDEGAPKDTKKSIEYLEQAAQTGHIKSSSLLTIIYCKSRDHKKAFEHFELVVQKIGSERETLIDEITEDNICRGAHS